jgi:hypothetical protein
LDLGVEVLDRERSLSTSFSDSVGSFGSRCPEDCEKSGIGLQRGFGSCRCSSKGFLEALRAAKASSSMSVGEGVRGSGGVVKVSICSSLDEASGALIFRPLSKKDVLSCFGCRSGLSPVRRSVRFRFVRSG